MVEERRRADPEKPVDFIRHMPSLLLLERLGVPVLAVHEGGSIVFANPAFEQMVGRAGGSLAGVDAGRLFVKGADGGVPVVEVIRAAVGSSVSMWHRDGTIVTALVTSSVFVRDDDPVVLVGFTDITDQLWERGPTL